MTQVRFIIIHPQTNASFIRRLTSMSESSKIALEFYTDISTLKKHQPVLDSSVVVVVQNTQFSLELQAYCVENNNRVVCWGSSLIAEKKLDNPTIWHCLGDPFSGRNFQTVITLMSTDISKEWIYNGKWGGLSHEIYATPQETMDQLQSFLQKFKLTGQINTSYWNALAKNICKQKTDKTLSALKITCDGNQLKLYWNVGQVQEDAIWSFMDQAQRLYDSVIRFDLTADALIICCEISLHTSMLKAPAVVILGQSQAPDGSIKNLLEAAG